MVPFVAGFILSLTQTADPTNFSVEDIEVFRAASLYLKNDPNFPGLGEPSTKGIAVMLPEIADIPSAPC